MPMDESLLVIQMHCVLRSLYQDDDICEKQYPGAEGILNWILLICPGFGFRYFLNAFAFARILVSRHAHIETLACESHSLSVCVAHCDAI